ncbi:MAG: DMT family transporter [Limnohabitans sp.]|jgi:drug/metabolite transporter (DMT)-like permease|nr:DMT family transporter [Limnohabitans sp.]
MSGAAQHESWVRAMPVVFVLIWSTGFIVARFAMPYSPPMTFLWVRYLLSILAFWLWIRWARVAWPQSRAQWWHLGVTGVFMHAGYLSGVWVAVKAGMGSGLSALIVGFQPVLTAIWLSSQGGQVTRRQWGGLLLGFVGLVLVVSRKLQDTLEVTPWTFSLAVLALFSITIGTLYQKRHVQSCDVRTANTVQLMAAALVTLPLVALESEAVQWHPSLFGAMAWSVLGMTLGGSSLFYMLIQRGAAASVSSLMYLVPPCTALLAWLLFDEPVTVTTLVGIVLTALGVSLVVRTPAPER